MTQVSFAHRLARTLPLAADQRGTPIAFWAK
jgi:hypothetical protein